MIKSESEFFHRALHSYRNIQCISLEEFNSDISRIMGIKKLIDKLHETPSYRLILNNLIVLFNVFNLSATELIIYRLPKEQLPILFPFLLYLNRLPEEIINRYDIELDENTIIQLRLI